LRIILQILYLQIFLYIFLAISLYMDYTYTYMYLYCDVFIRMHGMVRGHLERLRTIYVKVAPCECIHNHMSDDITFLDRSRARDTGYS
jgi:hypothetical protein